MTRHHPRTNTLKSAALLLESKAFAFTKSPVRFREKARNELQTAAVDFTAKLLVTGIALRDKR